MAITLKSSASCGDIIYSLPLARQLHEQTGEEVIYLIHHDSPHSRLRTVNTYRSLRTLLERQSYIKECLPYAGQTVTYDLDKFRKHKDFKNTPIWLNHFESHGIKPLSGAFRKWIEVDEGIVTHEAVYSETKRYRNYKTNFKKMAIQHKILSAQHKGKAVFVGTEAEYIAFGTILPHAQTYCLLDVANMLNQSYNVYCNQSAVLTIAQGLSHEGIHLAKDWGFNNTVFGSEIILN